VQEEDWKEKKKRNLATCSGKRRKEKKRLFSAFHSASTGLYTGRRKSREQRTQKNEETTLILRDPWKGKKKDNQKEVVLGTRGHISGIVARHNVERRGRKKKVKVQTATS